MSDSKIDCKQLEQLRDSLETMARNSDDFFEAASREIAARLAFTGKWRRWGKKVLRL